MCCQRHSPASLLPGKTRYPLYRGLGGPRGPSGRVRKISPPTGIWSPDRKTRSESVYRLWNKGNAVFINVWNYTPKPNDTASQQIRSEYCAICSFTIMPSVFLLPRDSQFAYCDFTQHEFCKRIFSTCSSRTLDFCKLVSQVHDLEKGSWKQLPNAYNFLITSFVFAFSSTIYSLEVPFRW